MIEIAIKDAQAWVDALRREGYGVTINLWAEELDVAVACWKDGLVASHGNAPDLAGALRNASALLGVE